MVLQYKYKDGAVFSKNGAPRVEGNEAVVLGPGLWQCRVEVGRDVWHLKMPRRIKEKGKYKLDEELKYIIDEV